MNSTRGSTCILFGIKKFGGFKEAGVVGVFLLDLFEKEILRLEFLSKIPARIPLLLQSHIFEEIEFSESRQGLN